jgi:hypothetical protein
MDSPQSFTWSKDEFLARFPYFGEYRSFHAKNEDGYTRHPLSFYQDVDAIDFQLEMNDPFISSVITSFYSLELKALPIGYLIPDERVELSIPVLRLDTRSQNSLLRHDIRFISELIQLSLQDLSDFNNLGRGSINKILLRLLEVSIRGDGFLSQLANLPLQHSEYKFSAEDLKVTRPSNFAISNSFLRTTYSIWGELPFLEYARRMETVGVNLSRLEKSFNVEDQSLSVKRGDSDYYRSWAEVFSKLNQRQIEVYFKRVILNNSETLESLGNAMGCTRENIRLMESHSRNYILSTHQERNSLLATLLVAFSASVKYIQSLPDLFNSEPWLIDEANLIGASGVITLRLFDFLLALSPEVSVHSNYIMPTDVSLMLSDILKGNPINGSKKITFDNWKNYCMAPETSNLEAEQMLQQFGVKRVANYLTATSTPLGDQIEMLLRSAGVSLDIRVLEEFFGTLFSPRYIVTSLQTDSRFVRTSRGLWGLSEQVQDTSLQENQGVSVSQMDATAKIEFPEILVLKEGSFGESE